MPSLCWVLDQHSPQAHRLAVLVVEGDLGLGVGTQVRDGPGPAHLGVALGHPVGHVDRQRHEHVGLVARVAEHHALVAGALLVELVLFTGGTGPDLFGVVDALGDVGRLLVERHHHTAGVAVEAERFVVVADPVDGGSHHTGDVHVGLGGDLARNDGQAGGDEGLAGDPAHRVLLEQGIEDGIADLVSHLVGVPLGHRLGGECEVLHVGICSWLCIAASRRGFLRRHRGPQRRWLVCRRARLVSIRLRTRSPPRWCRAQIRRCPPRRRWPRADRRSWPPA